MTTLTNLAMTSCFQKTVENQSATVEDKLRAIRILFRLSSSELILAPYSRAKSCFNRSTSLIFGGKINPRSLIHSEFATLDFLFLFFFGEASSFVSVGAALFRRFLPSDDVEAFPASLGIPASSDCTTSENKIV